MNTSHLPVIDLEGTPRVRGRLYGESTRHLIAEVLDYWKSDLGNFLHRGKRYSQKEITSYLSKFFDETSYLQAIKRWTPGLLEEVKGIAEGAGQSFDDILGLQLLDEEWVYGLSHSVDSTKDKCTAFGIVDGDGGITYAGQNMDVPSWVEGRQVLLRIRAYSGEPEALIFTMAGSLGFNGLNAKGLGVTCNTLTQLQGSFDGLPVIFILRSLLQQGGIDSAERFLRSIIHASGQNYILSSSGDVRCFECSSMNVVRYKEELNSSRVFHTNHPLINTEESNILPLGQRVGKDTLLRLESISSRLGKNNLSPSIEDIKAALSAHDSENHPVSKTADKNSTDSLGYTAGSSIYQFTDPPKLYLSSGPPCEVDYAVYHFNDVRTKEDN